MQINVNTKKCEKFKKATAVLMCGGKSLRMNNQPKQFLKLGEKTFLETIMTKLNDFDEVFLSCNMDVGNFKVVKDIYSDIGPIGGIYSTLKATEKDMIYIVACDMPMITVEFIEYLFNNLQEEDDCLVPIADGKIHPLCAIYKKSILPMVEEQINKENYRLSSLLSEMHTHYLKIPEDYKNNLLNVNTPESYDKLVKNI